MIRVEVEGYAAFVTDIEVTEAPEPITATLTKLEADLPATEEPVAGMAGGVFTRVSSPPPFPRIRRASRDADAHEDLGGAMDALALPRDPTLRISFPPAPERDEPNTLSPAELERFLAVMRETYPQHYPPVVLLAYTGLRFCHASALR